MKNEEGKKMRKKQHTRRPKGSASPLLLFTFFFLLFYLFSCGNPIIQKIVGGKTVTFETNGGSKVEDQMVFKGQQVRRPPDPSKPGYNFASWYRDNETFENEWNFDAIPDAEMTLYAKWNIKELVPITEAAISVIEPETDAAQSTVANGTGNFSIGAVSWSPDDNPFQAGVEYTATVTLTAREDYFFASTMTAATINGNDATVTGNTASTLTLVYTFPPTRTITGMMVKTQPGKLVYNHGDTLDLSGLVVTLTYNPGPDEDVALAGLAGKGITINYVDGIQLVHLTHNGKSITVSKIGLQSQDAGTLIVNQKELTVTGATHTKEYDGTATASGVTVTLGGIVNGDIVGATVTAAYTDANAGTTTINITAITLTGAAAENYTVTLPTNNLAVAGITKATPTGITWPTATVTLGQTLEDATFAGGVGDGEFTFNAPTYTPTETENGTAFPATFTPTNPNYSTLTGSIVVTVQSGSGGLYNIGDTGPGGGIIFYYSAGGFTVEMVNPAENYTAHYLEVAPAITGTSIQWGAYGTLIGEVTTLASPFVADAAKKGNGRKDTALIVAHLGTSESNRAAQICTALTTGGKNDWFLPSLGEFIELYKQRNRTGISITTGSYWTSSQDGYNGAWVQNFSLGSQFSNAKDVENSVRAVRAF